MQNIFFTHPLRFILFMFIHTSQNNDIYKNEETCCNVWADIVYIFVNFLVHFIII
jgi:hypothetical protein